MAVNLKDLAEWLTDSDQVADMLDFDTLRSNMLPL